MTSYVPRFAFLLILALGLVSAPAASASSVAYIDGNNLWLSSPDGKQKVQLTTSGTADTPFSSPAQGPDGKTVAVHREAFDNGDKRPALFRYGADGKQDAANLLPVYSGALIPVYPIGLDMDWDSQSVAYGYSYCQLGQLPTCGTIYRGYWLTFSDRQSLYPTNPQGQSDAFNPTYFGRRIISSDSGGSLFVQPDVPEVPFTTSYTGWLSVPDLNLSRAVVAPAGKQVAIEWSGKNDSSEGIFVGEHAGSIPSDVNSICSLPVVGSSDKVSFSNDGSQIAWHDAEGVKVAGAPNLAAGTDTCTLSSPPVLLSATGTSPDFGGADVNRILNPGGSGTTGNTGNTGNQGGNTGTQGNQGTSGTPVDLTGRVVGSPTRAAFAKGLKLQFQAGAGRLDVSASIPRSTARKFGLKKATLPLQARLADAKGFAAASSVVVAKGSARPAAPGKVTVTLKPTKAAKKKAKKLKGVTLTVKASQGGVTKTFKIKLK